MRARWVGRGAGGRHHGSGAACFPFCGRTEGRAGAVGLILLSALPRRSPSGATRRSLGSSCCHPRPSRGDSGHPSDGLGCLRALGGTGSALPLCHHPAVSRAAVPCCRPAWSGAGGTRSPAASVAGAAAPLCPSECRLPGAGDAGAEGSGGFVIGRRRRRGLGPHGGLGGGWGRPQSALIPSKGTFVQEPAAPGAASWQLQAGMGLFGSAPIPRVRRGSRLWGEGGRTPCPGGLLPLLPPFSLLLPPLSHSRFAWGVALCSESAMLPEAPRRVRLSAGHAVGLG